MRPTNRSFSLDFTVTVSNEAPSTYSGVSAAVQTYRQVTKIEVSAIYTVTDSRTQNNNA